MANTTYTDSTNHTTSLGTNENIVDRNMNQLHEIADQSHHDKTNSGSSGRLGELYPLDGSKTRTLLVGLRATVQEELAVSDEVLHRLNNISFDGHDKTNAYGNVPHGTHQNWVRNTVHKRPIYGIERKNRCIKSDNRVLIRVTQNKDRTNLFFRTLHAD